MILTDKKSYMIDIDEYKTLKGFIKDKRQFSKIFIEIGFGPDRFFIDEAIKNKDNLYIGIEIRKKRAVKGEKKIAGEEIDNAYIMWGEAFKLIDQFMENDLLNGIYINFPDPYHKKRHLKRRLISLEFLHLINKKLQNGGFFIIITDNEPYMEYINETFFQFIKIPHVFLDYEIKKGMPEKYPMTEFARRESKGKGEIQYLYAVKSH